jgi:hypothetical protein
MIAHGAGMIRNGFRLALVTAAVMVWVRTASANESTGQSARAEVKHSSTEAAAPEHVRSNKGGLTRRAKRRAGSGQSHEATQPKPAESDGAVIDGPMMAQHVPAHVANAGRLLAGFLIQMQGIGFHSSAGPTLVFGPINQQTGGPMMTGYTGPGLGQDAPHAGHDAHAQHHSFDEDK